MVIFLKHLQKTPLGHLSRCFLWKPSWKLQKFIHCLSQQLHGSSFYENYTKTRNPTKQNHETNLHHFLTWKNCQKKSTLSKIGVDSIWYDLPKKNLPLLKMNLLKSSLGIPVDFPHISAQNPMVIRGAPHHHIQSIQSRSAPWRCVVKVRLVEVDTWRIIPFRWLITMVSKSPIPAVISLPNGRTPWLINKGY